ncbi:MAG: retroviral-like aspartic protease family protein [Sedimentisphaerales bacterium]|nr:retroviral-like aspartic protease family protein [Sedimentisphaerales bacterium]
MNMLDNYGLLGRKIRFLPLLVAFLSWVPANAAKPVKWQRQEVNWHISGGSSIKAIYYPEDKPPMMLNRHRRSQPKTRLKALTPSEEAVLGTSAAGTVFVSVIDSPPLDGFVPWVVVSITDASLGYWDFDAVPSDSVVGNPLTSSPESDYAIGILDTGASAHVISDDDAVKTGMYGQGYVTSFEVELLGATGSAIAYTSNPLGLFIAGLDVLEPNGLLLDDSEMLGEYNVSVIAGDPVESPNLPTAIGIPLGVYTCAAFCNNKQFSTTIGGNDFNSPYIKFYTSDDFSVPSYSNLIELELRPSDASAVQYIPCDLLGDCGSEPDGTPLYPSTIWGMLSNQSLFFLPWVNVAEGSYSIDFLDGFMFDTGAQVTVISRTVASGLHLNLNSPDFPVEIMDVTGEITIAPGFFIDSLDIPADGEWLEYTNVPVVALNVDSPEGGTLDGIIGMNLFVDLNFVINGGGFDGPTLEFEHACRIVGDIVPQCGDCMVDYLDLAVLVAHWLEDSNSPNWLASCDLAPLSGPDELVNLLDFAALAQNWLEDLTP